MRERFRCALPLAVALIVALGAGTAAASGTTTSATVKPGRVRVHTAVTVSFKVPAATGSTGSFERRDVVSVTGPRHAGCTWSRSAAAGPVAAGAIAHVRLAPGSTSHWCRGRFGGQVTEYESTACGPPQAAVVCPLLVIAPQTIARFSFRVR